MTLLQVRVLCVSNTHTTVVFNTNFCMAVPCNLTLTAAGETANTDYIFVISECFFVVDFIRFCWLHHVYWTILIMSNRKTLKSKTKCLGGAAYGPQTLWSYVFMCRSFVSVRSFKFFIDGHSPRHSALWNKGRPYGIWLRFSYLFIYLLWFLEAWAGYILPTVKSMMSCHIKCHIGIHEE